MSEGQQGSSPLESERGRTSIKDAVVKKIAGMAAQDVDGIHMGGGASRAAGGLLSRAGGSQDHTRGISVDVGRTEAAIDLTMAIDYGRNILQTAERVRQVVSSRVEPLTGLRITELNVTISDVIFPEEGGAQSETLSLDKGEAGARTREVAETSTAARPDPSAEDSTAEIRESDEDETQRQPPPEGDERSER